MTALAVLYLKSIGQPLGALSTTVPGGDPPSLSPAPTLRVALPIPKPPNPPGSPVPRPITVKRGDVALVEVEADFDDPLEVFQWRLVTTTGPDGKDQHRLDRLGAGQVEVTRQRLGTPPNSKLRLKIKVPKLGSETALDLEVRDDAGQLTTRRLVFKSNDPEQTQVVVDDGIDHVVLVQGYAPAFVTPPP